MPLQRQDFGKDDKRVDQAVHVGDRGQLRAGLAEGGRVANPRSGNKKVPKKPECPLLRSLLRSPFSAQLFRSNGLDWDGACTGIATRRRFIGRGPRALSPLQDYTAAPLAPLPPGDDMPRRSREVGQGHCRPGVIAPRHQSPRHLNRRNCYCGPRTQTPIAVPGMKAWPTATWQVGRPPMDHWAVAAAVSAGRGV
jgi:hypothetical protein